ncbi:MAG: hypothetical protein AAF997_24890, partial [Myxococcota bacterium]
MLSDPLLNLTEYLEANRVSAGFAEPLAIGILFLGALFLAWLVDFLTNRILLTWVKRFAATSKTQWDNAMVMERVPDRLAHLAPILVIYAAVPFVFPKQDSIASIIQRLAMALVIITVALAINGALNAA